MRKVSTRCLVIWAAFVEADFELTSKPAKGPDSSVCGNATVAPRPSGWLSSSIRVMADRWTPASRATIEPRAHPARVDRTRSADTLFSCGPPPEPYIPCHKCQLMFLVMDKPQARVCHAVFLEVESMQNRQQSKRLNIQLGMQTTSCDAMITRVTAATC